MTDTSRYTHAELSARLAEFERFHTVPEDATYNTRADEYRHSQHPGVGHPVNELYESFQNGWQAAQAQQGEGEPVAFWDGDTGEAETAFQFEQDSIYRTPVYAHRANKDIQRLEDQIATKDECITFLKARFEDFRKRNFHPQPAQPIPNNLRLIFELGAQMGGGAKLTQEQCKAMLAATDQPAQQVPEGYKLKTED